MSCRSIKQECFALNTILYYVVFNIQVVHIYLSELELENWFMVV